MGFNWREDDLTESELKNLKPGDTVYYDTGRGYTHIIENTVKKITPTGRIVCERGVIFRPDGTVFSKYNYFTLLKPEIAFKRKQEWEDKVRRRSKARLLVEWLKKNEGWLTQQHETYMDRFFAEEQLNEQAVEMGLIEK